MPGLILILASAFLLAGASSATARTCPKCDAPGHGRERDQADRAAAGRNNQFVANQRSINALRRLWEREGAWIASLRDELGALNARLRACPLSNPSCPPLPPRARPSLPSAPAAAAGLPGRPVTDEDLQRQRAQIAELNREIAGRRDLVARLDHEILRLREGR